MVVILLAYVVQLSFAAELAYAEDLARRSTCARGRLLQQHHAKGVMPNVGLYHEVARARQAAKTQQQNTQLGLQLFYTGFVLEPRFDIREDTSAVLASLEQMTSIFGVGSLKQRGVKQLMCSQGKVLIVAFLAPRADRIDPRHGFIEAARHQPSHVLGEGPILIVTSLAKDLAIVGSCRCLCTCSRWFTAVEALLRTPTSTIPCISTRRRGRSRCRAEVGARAAALLGMPAHSCTCTSGP